MTWKYLLYAQYPACLLLALFFLLSYLRVRKASAVKSVLWVLLFGAALACSVLFFFLGIPEFWTFKTMFPLGVASWIGIVLVFVAMIAHIVHLFEKRHNKKVLEKELKRAAKEKEDAVQQAREEGAEAARQAHVEGRIAAHGEAEAARLSQAAEAIGAEVAASELGSAVQTPIELTLDAPGDSSAGGLPQAAFPAEGIPQDGGFPQAVFPSEGISQGGGFPQAVFPADGAPQDGGFPQAVFPSDGAPQDGGFPSEGIPTDTSEQ